MILEIFDQFLKQKRSSFIDRLSGIDLVTYPHRNKKKINQLRLEMSETPQIAVLERT